MRVGPIVRVPTSAFCIERARRAGFLVDASAYFTALDEAFDRAERRVIVLGWDVDSRTELGGAGSRKQFVERLNELVAAKPALEVFILSWDYATFYMLERELFPTVALGLLTDKRVHFQLDDDHPLGGSQHQKVVVVDDEIAFCGGLDITVRRWDTPEHAPDDPKRKDPGGEGYSPFHDVQMIVNGDAARGLARLARERIRRATGRELEPLAELPEDRADALWPPSAPVDATDVDVAITRTDPEYRARGRQEVREVEALTVAAIEQARWFLYLENQYFTSRVACEALCESLRRPEGPEVLVVGPECCSGWLEEQTMGRLRERVLAELFTADVHGRLRMVWPRRGETPIFVHSKVMVVDDALVRVGSANLTNRSFGLDTECDLAIDALVCRERGGEGAEARARTAARVLLARLVGEHLGAGESVARELVDAELAKPTPSLFAIVDRLAAESTERTLVPVKAPSAAALADAERAADREAAGAFEAARQRGAMPDASDLAPPSSSSSLEPPELMGIAAAADPERPLEATEMIERAMPTAPRTAERSAFLAAFVLVAVIALGLVVRFTPLGAALDLDALRGSLASLRSSPWAPFVVMLAFTVLCLVMVPVNALVLATGAAFGPVLGPLYALLGALASAMFNFGLGRWFGARALARFGGDRARHVAGRLADRGLVAVLLARIVPTAPFGLVNMVAGSCGVRTWHFAVGTVVGTLPGAIALGVFGDQLLAALSAGGRSRFALALAASVAIALAATVFWLRRRRRRGARGVGPEPEHEAPEQPSAPRSTPQSTPRSVPRSEGRPLQRSA